ncbi:MAG: 50S ribosomal protein L29 [Anaerolineae bacterium]|nr:50S ribosomal protein L29 [Anaerolineae bacterium]
MQAFEIRTWTTERLQEQLDDACRQLFALRRDEASGRLADTNQLKTVRRDIARMKTILRERELGAELIEVEGGDA